MEAKSAHALSIDAAAPVTLPNALFNGTAPLTAPHFPEHSRYPSTRESDAVHKFALHVHNRKGFGVWVQGGGAGGTVKGWT